MNSLSSLNTLKTTIFNQLNCVSKKVVGISELDRHMMQVIWPIIQMIRLMIWPMIIIKVELKYSKIQGKVIDLVKDPQANNIKSKVYWKIQFLQGACQIKKGVGLDSMTLEVVAIRLKKLFWAIKAGKETRSEEEAMTENNTENKMTICS